MPLAVRNFSAVGYANGFTLWHYKSPDSPGDCLLPEYFASVKVLLGAGDIVMVSCLAHHAALQLYVTYIDDKMLLKVMSLT